jgi:hypothetical protein
MPKIQDEKSAAAGLQYGGHRINSTNSTKNIQALLAK